MGRLSVLTISLVVLLAGTARADIVVGPLPPTYAPVSGELIESLEPVADAYWTERGVQLPAGPEVFAVYLDELEGSAGRGEMGGARVWISFAMLHYRSVELRAALCHLYIHERGHNAGLLDGDGWPVMGLGGSTPRTCWPWARAS